MTTNNEEILDHLVRHLHWLERYKASEVRRIIAALNKADNDLVTRIADRLTKTGRGLNLSKAETARLDALLKEIRDAKEILGAELYELSRLELTEFAEYESDFRARVIEGAAAIKLNRPNMTQLRAVVVSRPFAGRLLREWYQSLTEGQGRQISAAVRTGIIEGQTTDQIMRAIRGTRALKYRDGILEIGRRQTAALVRTAVAHVANAASEQVYMENDDVVEGVQWVSTLDSRTTTICASRDGKVFKIGQGPRPPAHFSCRSTTIPYLGPRTGSRASTNGPVPASTTYSEWLRRQTAETQNQILGPARARLFRDGQSLDSFVDPTGREYTLDELRQLD